MRALGLICAFLAVGHYARRRSRLQRARGLPRRAMGATEEQMRAAVSIERACADYPVTSRHLGDRFCDDWVLTSHGMSRWGWLAGV